MHLYQPVLFAISIANTETTLYIGFGVYCAAILHLEVDSQNVIEMDNFCGKYIAEFDRNFRLDGR